ncbi:MAG: hypothetical protein N2663_03105 [Chlorobi bacterium]|nr:hypothetical protein [Chlorobiota bacterium]
MTTYNVVGDCLGAEQVMAVVEGSTVTVEGRRFTIEPTNIPHLWQIKDGTVAIPVVVECTPTGKVHLTIRGYTFEIHCYPERLAEFRKRIRRSSRADHSILQVRAPMPGLVKAVNVARGATVRRGENLIVLEAMKMENLLRAPATGIVRAVSVTAGTAVEKGDVLCIIELDGMQ